MSNPSLRVGKLFGDFDREGRGPKKIKGRVGGFLKSSNPLYFC